MTDVHFYLSALRACKCGKPAAYEVRGSGNVVYDHCCKKCGPRRVKELTKAYTRTPTPTESTDAK